MEQKDMADENNGESSQPVAAVTPQPRDEKKGRDNVGESGAVARMLKQQERAAQTTPAESVVPAETPPAAPSAPTDAAQVSSTEETAPPAETTAPAESEDALSHEKPNLDPELKKWLQEKIGERVRNKNEKIKELETRLNQLMIAQQAQALQKPASVQPTAPLPNAPPLSHIEDTASLSTLAQDAKTAIRWGERELQRDDFADNPPINPHTNRPMSRKEVQDALWNARITLEDHIPQRAQFLEARQKQVTRANQDFPFLNDQSSPEYVLAQQVLMTKPYLKNDADGAMMVGFMVEGMKAAKARADALEKSKAKAPVVTKAPPASQTAVSSNGAGERVASGTRKENQIREIKQFLGSRKGVTVNEAIAAQTKFEQLRSR